ncbi:MAG: response regulator [Pseudomonadales bacterium]
MMQVLLIDDDEVFARTLGSALERRGYRVTVVTCDVDIDVALGACEYHYILLDLMLGETSSLGLIGSMRNRQPGAALILLSGYASIPATVQALRSGAINVLAKPVGVREVVNAMKEASGDGHKPELPPKPIGLRRLEWEHIQRVLADHDGNVSAAARSLGMHRRSLQRKLTKKPPRE